MSQTHGRRKPYREWKGKRLPPHAHTYYDRLGKLRNYYRIGKKQVPFCPGVEPLTKLWWEGYLAAKAGQPHTPAPAEKRRLIDRSFSALIAEYRRTSWRKLKPKTRHNYGIYLDLITSKWGDGPVAKVLPAHLEGWLSDKAFGVETQKAAPGAARNMWTVFSTLFELAVALDWRSDNPMRRIKRPALPNKDGHHTLTEAEAEALRRAYPDPASDERALLEIGIAWGARAGDLCNLGWKNIAKGEITFTPKKTENSTGAEVVLPVEGEHLLAVLAHRSKTDTFFFQQPPKGSNQYNRHKLVALNPKPWDYSRAQKMWKEMRERAGLDDNVVMHGMRKLFATRMANAGAPLTDIADALGDTEESAKIYVQKRNKRHGAARAFRLAAEVA